MQRLEWDIVTCFISYQPQPFASTKLFPLFHPSIFHSSCLSFHHILPLALCLYSSPFFTLSYSHLYLSFMHSISCSYFSSILPEAICLSSDLLLHLPSVVSCSHHTPHPPLICISPFFPMLSLSSSCQHLELCSLLTSDFLLFPALPDGACNTQSYHFPKYMHSAFTRAHSQDWYY